VNYSDQIDDDQIEELFDGIPESMKNANRWILWKSIPNQDPAKKHRKVPFYCNGNPRSGSLDSAEDNSKMATFDVALHIFAQSKDYAGLGFALGKDDLGNYWQGVDFDDISKWRDLEEMVSSMPGYVEASPSGNGYHAIGCGKHFESIGSAKEKDGIEAYAGSRFFTVTGKSVGGDVEDLSSYVNDTLRPIVEKSRGYSESRTSDEGFQFFMPKQQAKEVSEALSYIPAEDRDLWIKLGHCLKRYGSQGLGLWRYWSQSSSQYNPLEITKVWETLKIRSNSSDLGTIFYVAEQYGYANPAKNYESEIDQDDVLTQQDINDSADKDEVKFPPPFRGAMASAVESCLAISVKPQPALCVLSALIGMASACDGRKYQLSSGMRLNLYGLGLAQTGAGKDVVMDLANDIGYISGANTLPPAASFQGMEDSLTDNPMLLVMDEIGHWFSAITDTNAQSHMAMLAGALLRLFSASKTRYKTRQKARQKGVDDSRTILNPCLSIYGTTTPEKLGKALGASSAEDGLMGRFLFCIGDDNVKPRRTVGRFSLSGEARLKAEDILQAGGKASHLHEAKEIKVAPDADEMIYDLMVHYSSIADQSTNPLAKAFFVRSSEKMERISGVLAVWDCPTDPCITIEHVEWARQFVDASNNAILRFSSEYMSEGKNISEAKLLKKIIIRCVKKELAGQRKYDTCFINEGLVSRSMIMRHSRLGLKEMEDAIKYLINTDEIIEDKRTNTSSNGKKTIIGYVGLKR
jgi:hypothetical protein